MCIITLSNNVENKYIMNIVSSIVDAYSYADMYNNSQNNVEKVKAGGLPVNNLLHNLYSESDDKITGGGPFEDIVVPIGLILNLSQPKRYIQFVSEHDDSNCKIDVLSDSIFDEFIHSVSKKSKTPSRRTTIRSKR